MNIETIERGQPQRNNELSGFKMNKWNELKASEVQALLGLDNDALSWLCRGEDIVGTLALHLPSRSYGDELLERLEVAPKDRLEILNSRPDPDETPALWWVLIRAYWELAKNVGRQPQLLPFPILPANLGPLGRNLYIWVFLAALPLVRSYHKSRSIPNDISWKSLQDIGQKISTHRKIYGTSGLHVPQWSTLVFSGAIYQLGRLQFNRYSMPVNMPLSPRFSAVPRLGDNVLIPHISDGGKMEPEECSESFIRAREFFKRYFPEHPVRHVAGFGSWLLDEQLKYYLPSESNILFFQNLFEIAPHHIAADPESEWTKGDSAILEFVFHKIHKDPNRPNHILRDLPQDTKLKRSYVEHLESGGHWFARCGWFDLVDFKL